MPLRSAYNRAALNQMLREQFNVIGRSQLLSLEIRMSRSAIDYRIRDGGPWQVILPGVYATTTGTLTGNQRTMAALLYAGDESLVTGADAVRRHHLKCAGLNEIDVLIPASKRVQSTGFVRVTRTSRMPPSNACYRLDKIRYAGPARAVADAARGMTRLGDVRAVVASAVQTGTCGIGDLVTELESGPSAGSHWLRQALTEVSDGTRSSAEADFRTLIIRSNLETPMYNARLYLPDGTELGVADAWWGRAGVVGEVDSREFHLSPAQYEYTALRHNRLEAENINLLHFLPSTIRQRPDIVVRDLRRAIESGRRRAPLPIIAVPIDAPPPIPQPAKPPPPQSAAS